MAVASPDLVDKLEELVNCPICLELLNDPRVLPCQHSFCTGCLQSMLGQAKVLCCPCCKKNAAVVNGVKNLPKDFRANSWLEILADYKKNPKATVARAQAAESKKEDIQPEPPVEHNKPCPVCEQIPTEPRNLSCGHRLCEKCVEFLLPVGGVKIHCPTCSAVTTVTYIEGDTSSEDEEGEDENDGEEEEEEEEGGSLVFVFGNPLTHLLQLLMEVERMTGDDGDNAGDNDEDQEEEGEEEEKEVKTQKICPPPVPATKKEAPLVPPPPPPQVPPSPPVPTVKVPPLVAQKPSVRKPGVRRPPATLRGQSLFNLIPAKQRASILPVTADSADSASGQSGEPSRSVMPRARAADSASTSIRLNDILTKKSSLKKVPHQHLGF